MALYLVNCEQLVFPRCSFGVFETQAHIPISGKVNSTNSTCGVSWDIGCQSSPCHISQHYKTSMFRKAESHTIRSERDLMQHLTQAPRFPKEKTVSERQRT